jgi:hypothetical protein
MSHIQYKNGELYDLVVDILLEKNIIKKPNDIYSIRIYPTSDIPNHVFIDIKGFGIKILSSHRIKIHKLSKIIKNHKTFIKI